MSDSHIYELEDIVWDDFSTSDDHLVPYPQIQQNEGSVVRTESHKKLRHEAEMISSYGSHEGELVGVATEKTIFSSPKITDNKVLANGSWSHKPDNRQTGNDPMSYSSSEGPTVNKGDFIQSNNFNAGASNPTNICTAADNSVFCSLSDTQSESDLNFLYNGLNNKGVGDSLFYDWTEIENYDLNQMLRSCDSAFGLGDPAKEDDMCWFSSSTAVNGPDASSQLHVRSSYSNSNSLKIFSENCESPQHIYESPTVDAFKKRSAGANYTSSILASNTTGQSCVSKASSISELPTNSDKTDRGKPLKEVNKHTRKTDYQTQSMENNISFHHFDSSTQKTHCSFSKDPHKLLSSSSNGDQKQKVVAVTYSDPVSAQNSIFNSENEESLNKTSLSNEHPLEESSFLQLQEVMEQMDLKTKLRIRDSLYRLARSAEQRHGISTTNGACIVDKNLSEQTAGTKQARLLDIETDTNPVDRSIAHLLFHRPSDPSKIVLNNTRPVHNKDDGAELFLCDDVKNGGFGVAKWKSDLSGNHREAT